MTADDFEPSLSHLTTRSSWPRYSVRCFYQATDDPCCRSRREISQNPPHRVGHRDGGIHPRWTSGDASRSAL